MAGLVYYSSASGNTERFMHKLGLPAMRIPVDESAPMPEPDAPFVLISPTYADGEGHGAVARQVIRFLNDPDRRRLLRGVIASSNRNFGTTFAHAGRVIGDKCDMLFRSVVRRMAEKWQGSSTLSSRLR